MTVLKTSALAFVLVAATIAAACGGGNADLSLTGPSIGGNTSSTSGAVITGRVNGGSGLAQTTSSITPMSAVSLTVTVAGTGISTPVDSQGRFTLSGVPSGPVQLQFSGPGVNATITITVNGGEQIQIAVTVNGNSARVESEHRSGSNNRGELEGRITEIDATARTMRVSGTLVAVPADAIIRHGSRTLQLADLVVGDHVEVRGTIDGATFRASEVKVESDNRGHLTEREGTATQISGTCPGLTFNIGTTKVTTDGSTFFKQNACASVVEGARVEVKGRPQADGSLLAMQVEIEDDEEDANETEVKGAVSGLTGACPTPAFSVNGSTVTTSPTTRFEGGCAAVQNGVTVKVEGTRQANGSIAARKVEIEEDDDDDANEAEIKGAVAGLNGACPTPSFTVNGTSVTTTAATRFDDGCSAVQNGRRVEVKGTRQSNGSVVASRVKIDN
jgi:hypothetical protein